MTTETENIMTLAHKVNADGAELVYDESIRELVKILARKAAERGYEEFLEVMQREHGEDISD